MTANSNTPIDPPRGILGSLRNIGPGIIVSGSIVGSGELVVTTTLGAEVGFALLWLILFSCFIKVFLQIELGRHVVSSGETVLEALDAVPGPGLRIGAGRLNWLNALWAIMAFCSIVQLGGILTGLVGVFELATLGLHGVPAWIWPLGIGLLTSVLLATGRYRLVETTSTALVCGFTMLTVTAVFAVQSTEYSISVGELATGLVPSVPPTGLVTAFAMLGITGVGAAELVYYPYWCLEKGYARFAGPPDGSADWLRRARGWIAVMRVDAWVSCLIYTVGTTAFYLLGAAVLHQKGILPTDENLHPALAQIYVTSFSDPTGTWLYAAGAVAVLFSTFFVATASNARVVADGLHVFGVLRLAGAKARRTAIRILCIALPVFCWAMVTFVGKPMLLIMIGGIAQAALLPFLAIGIVWLRYRRTRPELVQRSVSDLFLWVGLISTSVIGVHQVYKLFTRG